MLELQHICDMDIAPMMPSYFFFVVLNKGRVRISFHDVWRVWLASEFLICDEILMYCVLDYN